MIRNRSKQRNQTLIQRHQQLDPTEQRRNNNYLPELPPPPYVPRKPARISTPAAAVDPPELPRPHHHRSFVNQRFSENPNSNLYLPTRIEGFLSGFSQDHSFRDTHQKKMQFFFLTPFFGFPVQPLEHPKKKSNFFLSLPLS